MFRSPSSQPFASSFRRVFFLSLVALLAIAPSAAHASSKEMIQLQTQIQQLQDAVARLQQSNDENMGVLKDLVQQTSDAVNKMTLTMGSLKLEMDNNRDAAATNAQQLAGQIQSLNDSLDELKARMTRMQKTLGEVQGQQQQTAATLANLPPAGGAVAAPTTAAPGGAGAAPVDSAPASAAPADNGGTPAPGSPLPMPDNSAAPAGTGAPMAASGGPGASATDLYRAAYADYIAGKQQLAASEFSGLIKAYPDGNLSGNAYFYRGEMDFRAGRNAAAVKEFDQVLERYPDNSKIPAAELHKGEALIAMGQREPGIHELHALVLRFPISPEAAQAKQKLATLGARR